jgi:hypothetical protein
MLQTEVQNVGYTVEIISSLAIAERVPLASDSN